MTSRYRVPIALALVPQVSARRVHLVATTHKVPTCVSLYLQSTVPKRSNSTVTPPLTQHSGRPSPQPCPSPGSSGCARTPLAHPHTRTQSPPAVSLSLCIRLASLPPQRQAQAQDVPSSTSFLNGPKFVSLFGWNCTSLHLRLTPPRKDGCSSTFHANFEKFPNPLPCGPTEINTPPGAR